MYHGAICIAPPAVGFQRLTGAWRQLQCCSPAQRRAGIGSPCPGHWLRLRRGGRASNGSIVHQEEGIWVLLSACMVGSPGSCLCLCGCTPVLYQWLKTLGWGTRQACQALPRCSAVVPVCHTGGPMWSPPAPGAVWPVCIGTAAAATHRHLCRCCPGLCIAWKGCNEVPSE